MHAHAGGKHAALAAVATGEVVPFLQGAYDAAHAPTDYRRWINARRQFDIKYADGCGRCSACCQLRNLQRTVSWLQCCWWTVKLEHSSLGAFAGMSRGAWCADA